MYFDQPAIYQVWPKFFSESLLWPILNTPFPLLPGSSWGFQGF